ncbi:response regulator [Shewanella sp. GXUN23E]|uniref:response regulator n=1 Tax=Shewanella sp. GXUN23E TaxID=3422498 RepID=UPI003D7D4CF2
MEHVSIDQLSILLIEPSCAQRKIIMNQLMEEGIHSIKTAGDLTTGKQLAEQLKPDLVVSAMHFADGTALELVAHVKSHSACEETQFMLISSEIRKEQLEAYRQSGVVAILPKPFELSHLHSALLSTVDLLGHDELDLDYLDVTELRVLLVDDSGLSRKIIRRTLNTLGMNDNNIIEAQDGKEAIGLLQTHEFDLVITDYNMPLVDGLMLAKYIRQYSQQPMLPILMVSSDANESHLSNVARHGVNALCDKPFEPQLVRRLLKQLLEE